MADASEVFVLVPGTSVNEYANTGKVPWQRFGGHPDTICEGGDLIKFGRVLSVYQYCGGIGEEISRWLPFV
jgi:hypothetical protein